MSSTGKNNDAWLRLEDELELLQAVETDGAVVLTADQIRTVREPRLLTKIDSRESQAAFLSDNNLGILPKSRNQFILGNFDIFLDVPNVGHSTPKEFTVPDLLGLSEGANSESTMILRALHAGVFDDFLGEEFALSTFGKMGTNAFSFTIDGHPGSIDVRGAQIEIDAGLENENNLALLEAKNHFASSFNLRQLYYPFRSWRERAASRRQIRNLFVAFEDDEVHLLEIDFPRIEHYSSGQIARTGHYRLIPSSPLEIDLRNILLQPAKPQQGLGEILPQADRVHRVLNLATCALDSGGRITNEEVASNQDFVDRQAGYYINAGIYLGIFTKVGSQEYELTPFGYRVATLNERQQAATLRERLAYDPIVRAAINGLLQGKPPKTVESEVVKAFREVPQWSAFSESTNHRRAQTFISWAKWTIRGSKFD